MILAIPAIQSVIIFTYGVSTLYALRPFGVTVSLKAEPEEKDWEAEFKKMEKEAEERLDVKVAEMMANIEKTGSN
jgi:hypothetical protein